MTQKPQPIPPTRPPMPNEDLPDPGPGGPPSAPGPDVPAPGTGRPPMPQTGAQAETVRAETPADRTTTTHTATEPRAIPPEGLDHPEVTKTEARQGRTTGHVRWILGISVALAFAAMGIVFLWAAA